MEKLATELKLLAKDCGDQNSDAMVRDQRNYYFLWLAKAASKKLQSLKNLNQPKDLASASKSEHERCTLGRETQKHMKRSQPSIHRQHHSPPPPSTPLQKIRFDTSDWTAHRLQTSAVCRWKMEARVQPETVDRCQISALLTPMEHKRMR